MSNSSTAFSVPLPHRSRDNASKKPPVWPIQESADNPPAPLPSKCSRNDRDGGVCCKELKGEDERTLVDPDIVRDVVIGLSDGLTVPFALTAGLSSLGESKLVVLGGIAELIAGALSMGIGGFLASQAERDHYLFVRRNTLSRVRRSCEGELEREVHRVLGPLGVEEPASRAVVKCLRDAEGFGDDLRRRRSSSSSSSNQTNDEETGSRLRWSKDVGLTAFLMKFGEGIEDVPMRRVYGSAITIGLGYLIGGLIPLLPYFFIQRAHIALLYSCILTGVVLLIFGAVKARITGAGQGMKGYIYGAVSTLLVGGAAAGAAYGIVKALEGRDKVY